MGLRHLLKGIKGIATKNVNIIAVQVISHRFRCVTNPAQPTAYTG